MSIEGDKMSTIGTVLVINGPNLNMLGSRETNIYGNATLNDIVTSLTHEASKELVAISHVQSNHEGVLVDAIQQAQGKVDFIIINLGLNPRYTKGPLFATPLPTYLPNLL